MGNILIIDDDQLICETIADAVRAILDGHIVLSRDLADRGHYPSIDVLGSISRLMPQVTDPEHMKNREKLVKVAASYRKAEDLININAYVQGTNPDIDYALQKKDAVDGYLRQAVDEAVSMAQAQKELTAIFAS